MAPDALVRGVAFSTGPPPYLRARATDADRLPADTWAMAQVPVGVRLEMVGGARAVDIAYTTTTDQLGYRGAAAGSTFAAWSGETLLDEKPAALGHGHLCLELGAATVDRRVVVYLPEGMRPTVHRVDAVGGELAPAPEQPRWIAYGDSITEGWSASGPALAWPAVAARRLGLDVVNLGYAGAARAEIVSAEEIADLPAGVVSLAVGTNCWNRIPHSAAMMRETFRAFVDVVRSGQPTTPIVVLSPVIRPDAEATPNRLGATLADLRAAIESVVTDRLRDGDDGIALVSGGDLIAAGHLADGVHPGDAGHRIIATAVADEIDAQLGRATTP